MLAETKGLDPTVNSAGKNARSRRNINDFRAVAGMTPEALARTAFRGAHAAQNRALAMAGFCNTFWV